MDVVGNNIANVNTTAFKQSRVTFQDILSQTVRGAGSPQGGRAGVNPEQVGLGATSVPNYEELQRLVEEREALLNINRAIGRHLNRDELFGALAICLGQSRRAFFMSSPGWLKMGRLLVIWDDS